MTIGDRGPCDRINWIFSVIGSYLPVADSEYFDKNSQQVGGRAEYPWRRATLMMENPCLELLITLLKINRNVKNYFIIK